MGNKYEVNVWDRPDGGSYSWIPVYRGEKLITTLYSMWWAKRQGWKCIKLEYRP